MTATLSAALDLGTVASRRRFDRATLTRVGFILPVVVYTAIFFGYPLIENIILSFQDYNISSLYSGSAPFNGIANYTHLFTDPVFRTAAWNTVVFVAGSLVCQFAIGLALASFFRRAFPLHGLLRSLLLIPWLLPLVVTGTVFRWMLNTSNGVLNEILRALHLIGAPVPWLDSVHTAMIGVLICNIWIGIPFNMVILYGGLQSIPGNLYEAAALDGAGRWTQFHRITLPMLRPVITVVLTLGLIYTIKVFDIIWVLTGGGPANATQLFATYAYQLGIGTGLLSQGAAISLAIFPILLLVVIVQLLYIRRTETL